MMSKGDEYSVVVEGVSKDFILPHEKKQSLKQTVLQRGSGTKEVQHALKDISFSVKKGEFFGIVGRNGSGKSTLLKMLAGIYVPTEGSIKIDGSLVPFIELGVGFNPELTGRDNVYLNGALLGFSREDMDEMYDDIVDFAEIERFMDQKLKNYSSGMQVRLAFSIAIRAHTDILLIDEVLAVGDVGFQEKCFNVFKKLKAEGRTIIFISHDMRSVERFCDRVMVINNSNLIAIGETKDMILEYGSIVAEYEIERQEKRKKTKNKRVGTKEVTIKKVELLSGSGEPVNHVNEHKPFSVRVHYDATKDVSGAVASMSIFNQDELKLIGVTTASQMKDGIVFKKGEGTITVEIKENLLASGPYVINVGIFANNLVYAIDHLRGALEFRINGKQRTGLLAVDASWDHEVVNSKKRK